MALSLDPPPPGYEVWASTEIAQPVIDPKYGPSFWDGIDRVSKGSRFRGLFSGPMVSILVPRSG